MASLQGCYLVAPPRLTDDNFFRTVVLVIEHDDAGAIGVILNRPTADPVREVLLMLDEDGLDTTEYGNELIYYGGPVTGPLVVLHKEAEFSERQILPGIHFSSQKDNLQKILSLSGRTCRVFSGYAGWAAGQLEGELEMGGWFVVPVGSSDLFDESDNLWQSISSSVGMEILGDVISPQQIPDDPSVN